MKEIDLDNFIILGNAVLFPAIWIFVSFLISKTGKWTLLAAKFRTDKKIPGDRFILQSGRFGLTKYNGALIIIVGHQGIHLSVFPLFRLFHPPLLIPWEAVRNVEMKQVIFYRYVRFDIGYPETVASVMLSAGIMKSRFWKERFPTIDAH